VTKLGDVSTPKLFLDAVAGKLDNNVTIKFTTTTKGKVETFLTYEMEKTGLSLSSSGATGHVPGISGSPETVGYDPTQMKTI